MLVQLAINVSTRVTDDCVPALIPPVKYASALYCGEEFEEHRQSAGGAGSGEFLGESAGDCDFDRKIPHF